MISPDKIAVLFDLDGVLIDSETEYTKIWERIERRYPTGIKDFARKIKGTTLTDILNRYFPDPEVQPRVIELLLKEEKEMRYRYCAGAEDLLKTLEDKGVGRAIVTSSDEVKMAHLREDIPELYTMVNVIIDASMVTRSKPDPQGYLIAAQELGIEPERCAVFEDSLQGMRAGKAAGAFVVGITTTLGREAVEDEADLLVDSLEAIDIDNLLEILSNR